MSQGETEAGGPGRVPQVRVRSLDANLGGGTLALVRRRF
jgi:hypothetical protein